MVKKLDIEGDVVLEDGISSIICGYYDKLENRYSSGSMWGYKTDFNEYDYITKGLHNSELTVIAGRHSMGKSAFVLNMALNLAKQNIPVLYVSYEMEANAIVHRLISILTKINNTKIKECAISADEWDKIAGVLADLGDLCEKKKYLNIIPSCTLYYKELFDLIREFKVENKDGVVIIDSFQLVKLYKQEDSRIIELASLAVAFKHLAVELNLPIVLVSEVSKKCVERNDKRPILTDLAECDSLAQHADNILFLYRDEYYNSENVEKKNVAEFEVAKQKNGPKGTFELLFQESIGLYRNKPKMEIF